jgi:hypothetical protein
MTFEQFAPMFAALALQLQAKDADAVMARAYYLALKDLEPEFVALAAQRMAKQGGSDARKLDQSPHWFPKTSEWRVEAAKAEADRIAELKARLRKLREPLCSACEDTGWDRRQDDRVVPCSCRSLRRLEVLGRRPMPQLPSGDAA